MTGSPLRVRVVDDVVGVRTLRADWDRLAAVTPLAAGFQAFGWVQACLRALPLDGHQLSIAVVSDGEVPVGIFPTRRSRSGRLTFISQAVSNYGGPVLVPERTADIVIAWRDALALDRRVRSIDLAGLRAGSPLLDHVDRLADGPWGRPHLVRSSMCPELDLTPGWPALRGMHKARQRSTWDRKWRRLSSLGVTTFVEATHPDAIRARLPEALRLYDERWGDRWTSGAFSAGRRPFQAAAVDSGVERLSMITIDDRVVAFSMGIIGNEGTTSYALAHDERLSLYSPGLLLLLRTLEAAADRGERSYDFSLGQMSYKALWAASERPVYRLHLGPGAGRRAASGRLWVRARAIEPLQRLKVDGPRIVRRLARRSAAARTPTSAIGRRSAATVAGWHAARVGAPTAVIGSMAGSESRAERVTELAFGEMVDRLAPSLLTLALERHYRGDRLVLVTRPDGRPLGIAWRAGDARREQLVAAFGALDTMAVWHDPIAITPSGESDLIRALLGQDAGIVTSASPIDVASAIPLGLVPDAGGTASTRLEG